MICSDAMVCDGEVIVCDSEVMVLDGEVMVVDGEMIVEQEASACARTRVAGGGWKLVGEGCGVKQAEVWEGRRQHRLGEVGDGE